jgi:DNA repair ATPase RecN
VNVQQKIEQVQALVDAIERALPALTDDQIRANAEELVSEIRAELNSATPTPSRFKVLATAAMTSIATAAGTDLGKAIVETALPLMS